MPDARVERSIPGTDFRPGDLILRDEDEVVVLARILRDDELEMLRAHRSHLAVFRPMSAWLTARPWRPDCARILRLVPAGQSVRGHALP